MTRYHKLFLKLSFFIFKSGLKRASALFLKKDEGSSITEFALVFPFFILVLFAAIQIGIIMVIQNALEAAAREASRYAITGQAGDSGTRDASIKDKVLTVLSNYSGGIIKPLDVVIKVKAYPDLPSLEAAGTPVSSTFGVAGQAVLYEISYSWNTIFPIFGSSSVITLKGMTPVINEYY